MSAQVPRRESTTVAARNLAWWLRYIATTWWRGGPDYAERIEYFTNRALLRAFRGLVSVCAMMFAAISVALVADHHSKALAGSPTLTAALQVAGAATGLSSCTRS